MRFLISPPDRPPQPDAPSPSSGGGGGCNVLVHDGFVHNLADANKKLVELGKVDDEGVHTQGLGKFAGGARVGLFLFVFVV